MPDLIVQIGTQHHQNLKRQIISDKRSAQILQQSISIDVTDNKNDANIVPLMLTIPLNIEEERRKTFQNWPLNFIDKNRLAQTGMYFTGDEDKVKCYFCKVEIGRWEESDNPVGEHLRWSPNCPLLKRRSTNNIPIDEQGLDQVLPATTYDVCGNNDYIEIRPGSFEESCITSNNPTPAYLPDHPEYAIESARIRSYKDWPRLMKQTPEQLSEAGFFYTGVGDRVICYNCGGGLKDWDEDDNPWEQHALWFNNCPYLKLMKGQSYIDSFAKLENGEKQTVETHQQETLTADTNELNSSSSNNVSTENNHGSNCIRNNTNINNRSTAEVREPKNQTNVAYSTKNLQSSSTTTTNTTTTTTNTNKNNDDQLKKSDNKKIIPEDEKLCKICYAGEYNTAFLPCGHVVACAKCASSVTKCPMCRKPFTNIMRVYFS